MFLINKVKCPKSLQTIKFERHFNQPVEDVKYPNSLHNLFFGDAFNQPILRMKFPNSLSLSFGKLFIQPINVTVFNKNLRFQNHLSKIPQLFITYNKNIIFFYICYKIK
jgi:hypothetical protein